MPKPNTMDDWLDKALDICSYADKRGIARQEAKALITAKMNEVDRAARIEGYAQGASDCITDLHNQGAISGLSKAESLKRINQMREDRLASLKGGDV